MLVVGHQKGIQPVQNLAPAIPKGCPMARPVEPGIITVTAKKKQAS